MGMLEKVPGLGSLPTDAMEQLQNDGIQNATREALRVLQQG